jgi:hypothetical protein
LIAFAIVGILDVGQNIQKILTVLPEVLQIVSKIDQGSWEIQFTLDMFV